MRIYGYQNNGYQGKTTWIETDIRNGFPGFDIVGLPDTGIKESKERVRSAIRNSGFKFPQQRILVSLHPAGEHKSGALLDLGIALSILLASSGNHGREEMLVMTAGELTLEGEVVPAPQALGAINAAKSGKCNLCLVPFPTDNPSALHVKNLRQAYAICMKESENPQEILPDDETDTGNVVFGDVIGMEEEKETMCIAAAGFHSIFMFGPPGVGKTLLCSRLNLLLPDNGSETADELTRIYGCTGLTPPGIRPAMRRLTVDSSAAQFCSTKLPGEASLAHGGVLMLDEVNKLSPKLTESIKTAYDNGVSGTYPARFLMAANMNACPCGHLGKKDAVCICNAHRLETYWHRPGTAFLERFDIRLPVKPYDLRVLNSVDAKQDSWYTDRVREAAERQKRRFRDVDRVNANGQVHLNPAAIRLLEKEARLVSKMSGNADTGPRNLIGTITLARTIADLDQREDVNEQDILKARQLRRYGFGDYYWKTLL